ncbi:hypothetical protein V1477_006913 [Vespula maculifrons]|uniref:Uncharacterized protein n=5 Tax=Vespula TaxID=7451 RepID=A0A834JZZ5_VESGE|nr:hypothetical protein HZH66_008155 [Vespula vulgaris]KAF7397763.1 hypothetical protein HZH68_008985 [Vespula germanica]KAF7421946.1 hypothetical protein H0235_009782 [Vespula pensylvanica]
MKRDETKRVKSKYKEKMREDKKMDDEYEDERRLRLRSYSYNACDDTKQYAQAQTIAVSDAIAASCCLKMHDQ